MRGWASHKEAAAEGGSPARGGRRGGGQRALERGKGLPQAAESLVRVSAGSCVCFQSPGGKAPRQGPAQDRPLAPTRDNGGLF